uniref:Si:ch211-225b11.1 n=1 Tax=Neogobius melanostomus TaxID=47308 RepID=A0A8C6V4E9_9GOBI
MGPAPGVHPSHSRVRSGTGKRLEVSLPVLQQRRRSLHDSISNNGMRVWPSSAVHGVHTWAVHPLRTCARFCQNLSAFKRQRFSTRSKHPPIDLSLISSWFMLCAKQGPKAGVGLATVVISFVFSTYYNVLMSWAIYYLFNSFRSTLPWQSCNDTWNVVQNCSSGFPGNVTHLQSASQQFFDNKLLEKTDGIEDSGGIRWELLGCLVAAWVIVYFCIFKGVKSTGKVVYFTAVYPYFILFALLINNVQLPGAINGILYFVTPVWSKLFQIKVWVNAAAQVFNSIGIGFGSMVSMSSYNKFNNNVLRDAFIVTMTNSFTSILAGFVIFSAIGYMAHIHNLPVENIATDGPGLVFVVYPEVISTMPLFQLWAPLFFIMLLCLGLDSQFATVEVAITFLKDEFGTKILPFLKREELLTLVVCLLCFLLGLPHITKGGIYVFQLMDHYTAVVSLMFLAFAEVVSVCWVFGTPRISLMVKRMLGRSPNIYFRVCWLILCPMLVLCILVASIVQYTPVRYGKYKYPSWAEGVGWGVSLVSIIWIPLGAIHELYINKGSLHDRLKSAVTPTVDLDVDNSPDIQSHQQNRRVH